MPLLEVTGLSKSYGGAGTSAGTSKVLQDIAFSLASGEYIAIMGESGIGKSTLLNLIAGLDTADGGRIRLDGTDLTALNEAARTRLRRRSMGFVFQAFHLFPHLTVAQNVALPLALNHVPPQQAADRVSAMLDAVGLAGLRDRYPRQLSGGQMQRVAIARALVHQPRLVLADEPTGNLDQESARQVLALLRRRISGSSAAGILVTHSPAAAATADRVLVLTAGGLSPQPVG